MGKRKYDFAGWVTKNDILCADGVTIKHDAFKQNNGQQVPLVWNHEYNSPKNVLGHVELKNEKGGVYGYGFFNDTEEAQSAKELVKHGDISSMSIGARKLKRSGSNVVHGLIYEVSLVLSGANPGAMIDSVVTHSDEGDGEEEGIVYPGTLIHTPEDILTHNDNEGGEETVEEENDNKKETNDEKTIEEVVNTMNEDQKRALYALVGIAAEGAEETEEEEQEEEKEDEGDEDTVKQNVFNNQATDNNDVLMHNVNESIKTAMETKASSLREVMEAQGSNGETLTHGINSIEMLFPEAAHQISGKEPVIYKDPNTASDKILNATRKSPFSKIKTLFADLTEDEARARGYITGNFKKEEFFSLIKRETGPTTIYKKQKIDRDDLVDITDFNVVAFMNREMRVMLKEELARAILVGDGREYDDEDKVNEERIRPIISDHEFFTIQKEYTDAENFLESTILAMAEYRGSGQPTMYIDPKVLVEIKLLKGTDNRFLFGDIPSTQAVASRLGVKDIVATSFMDGRGAIIVNLNDYVIGASKGGEITNFDDFDIDFNQYKYLIETRVSGSLVAPKSAIRLHTTKGASANDTEGGMSWGKRQVDKVEEEPPAGE